MRSLTRAAIVAPPLLFIISNVTLCTLLPFVHMDTVIRLTYNANTLYLPLLLGLAASVLFVAPRSRTRLATTWLTAALLLLSLRIYATHIEPYRLQVREATIYTNNVRQPLSVLHMSDIQSPGLGSYEARVFARVRALKPDMILYTGDFLQPLGEATIASELSELAAHFRSLKVPLGIFAVEGESDHAIRHLTPGALGGVRFLHTEAVTLQHQDTVIHILGLQLADTRTRGALPMEQVERWLSEAPDGALRIVLGHRPDYMMRLDDHAIDLCVAGHTHGGQVRVPFFGPIMTSSGVPRDWTRGFRVDGRAHFNVSAGIGSGHNKGLPAIRFNCPPEMTLLHLLPEKEGPR